MKNSNFLPIFSFVFSFFTLYSSVLESTIFQGTLVLTARGLVPVENLKVGQKLVSCTTDGKLVEFLIKDIGVHRQNIAHRFFTHISTNHAEEKYVCASPSQEFYDPVLGQWIKASQIRANNFLMDDECKALPICWVDSVCVSSKLEYYLELQDQHVFFISDCSYTPDAFPDNLVLVHNFTPVGVGIAGTFGSTLSSMSFSDVAFTVAGVALKGGPQLKVVGAGLTLAALGYELFFKKDENLNDQKNQNEKQKGWNLDKKPGDPNKNNNEKDEKERIINTLSKGESFEGTNGTFKGNRKGYFDRVKRGGPIDDSIDTIDWDRFHKDWEAYTHGGKKHVGSLDPKTLKLYKGPVVGRKL